jgi:opacity protein-like surface antigen
MIILFLKKNYMKNFLYLFLFIALATQSYSDEKGNEFNVRVNAGYVYSNAKETTSGESQNGHGGYGSISFDYFKFHFNNVTLSPFVLSIGYHYLNNTSSQTIDKPSESTTYMTSKFEHLITVTMDPTINLLKGFVSEDSSLDLYGKIGIGSFTTNINSTVTNSTATYFFAEKKSYANFVGGVGLNLNFTRNIALNVEYIGIPNIKLNGLLGAAGAKAVINIVKTGLSFKF